MSVNAKMTAIADAIREKTGGTEPLTLDQMATEIAGIQVGTGDGSSGIGAVKFVDVDITVEASTTTTATYTIDDVEMVSSSENVTGTWNVFPKKDVFLTLITPKEITGELSGESTKTYNGSMCVSYGNSNYTPCAASLITTKNSGVSMKNYGIYGAVLTATAAANGKATGKLSLNVRHASGGTDEVAAGIYNVQVWHLTDFAMDWGA